MLYSVRSESQELLMVKKNFWNGGLSVKGEGRGEYQHTDPAKKFKIYLSTGP